MSYYYRNSNNVCRDCYRGLNELFYENHRRIIIVIKQYYRVRSENRIRCNKIISRTIKRLLIFQSSISIPPRKRQNKKKKYDLRHRIKIGKGNNDKKKKKPRAGRRTCTCVRVQVLYLHYYYYIFSQKLFWKPIFIIILLCCCTRVNGASK